jgi:hypothetical protein
VIGREDFSCDGCSIRHRERGEKNLGKFPQRGEDYSLLYKLWMARVGKKREFSSTEGKKKKETMDPGGPTNRNSTNAKAHHAGSLPFRKRE